MAAYGHDALAALAQFLHLPNSHTCRPNYRLIISTCGNFESRLSYNYISLDLHEYKIKGSLKNLCWLHSAVLLLIRSLDKFIIWILSL